MRRSRSKSKIKRRSRRRSSRGAGGTKFMERVQWAVGGKQAWVGLRRALALDLT
jgi:hypothetical protein